MAKRDAETSAALAMLTSTREAMDRDMQKWWQEYTTKINFCQSIRDQSLCTDPETLSDALGDIQTNIEKVKSERHHKHNSGLFNRNLR